MVVDHVEHHHQAESVGPVDERLEVLGRAIGMVRRVVQHAVIAPAARAGKIRDGHQLDRRDAEIGQLLELPRQGREGAFGRRRADMRLVDHRLFPRPPLPVAVLPGIAPRIENLARPVDVVGLEARGRIGDQKLVIHPEAIGLAGLGAFEEKAVPFALGLHLELALRRPEAGRGERGGPKAEIDAVRPQDGTERHFVEALHAGIRARGDGSTHGGEEGFPRCGSKQSWEPRNVRTRGRPSEPAAGATSPCLAPATGTARRSSPAAQSKKRSQQPVTVESLTVSNNYKVGDNN